MTVEQAQRLAIDGGEPVLSKPLQVVNVEISDADVEAAVTALRSGMVAQGPRVAEFESRFAALTGAPHAAACANGTCALQLAYGALLEPGDEVLTPAWTYIATVSMLVAGGAKPIFCDVDPRTFNIDVKDAAKRITSRTKAIAVTHLYGNPVDIDAVEALAKKHGLKVIYDAAQSHLATYKGKGLGAFGDAVTYSFYPTKNMTTCEGGMVTTRDTALDKVVRSLRSHGEAEKYVHDRIGFNYRMTDIEAAIGCSQLDRIESRTLTRRRNAETLTSLLADLDGVTTPVPTEGAEHAWHLYTIRIDPDQFEGGRDRFLAALRAEGVNAAVHYPRALVDQPCFAEYADVDVPVSRALARSVMCIPAHDGLTEADLENVAEAVRKVAGALRNS